MNKIKIINEEGLMAFEEAVNKFIGKENTAIHRVSEMFYAYDQLICYIHYEE